MSLFNRLFRAEEPTRLSEVSQKVQKMLANDRREFDLAMSALLGDAAWEDVWGELRSLDREVNRLEREIRRHLLVHASVYGAIETPAVLVYMSIVKDIERVGDYAKNLLDLARDGASFQGLPSEELWREFWWEGVSTFIGDAAEAFRAWDGETARRLLSQGDEFLSHADKRVSTIVRGDDQWEQQVARALALRYLKRVVAHIMNLLTALVMP
ncbi:MAG: PhoU domain-containing protein, partial [Gemmatimonadales bacterium]